MRMLAIALTFAQTIVMTRVFGSEVFGLLSVALSVSALMVLVLSIGLDQILMRDIARIGKARVVYSQRWGSLWQLILRWLVPLTLAVSVIGVLLIALTEIGGVYRLPLMAAFLLLPIILSRKFIESICLGTKQVVRSIMGSQIVYPILMILGGIAIWSVGVKPDAQSVALTYALAVVGSTIASLLLITGTLREIRTKTESVKIDSHENTDLFENPTQKTLLKSGMYFSLVSLGFVLGQHIDVLLMGILSTPGDAALVRIAARVAEMAGLMRAIIVLQYKPLIAEAHGKNDIGLLQKHASFMVKIFTLTGLPITIFLWVFAEEVMMVFGSEFADGAWAMRIYIAGVLVSLLLGPGGAFLSMTGYEKIASRILLIVLCIHLIFGIILIPFYGVIGCAFANFLSICFWAIVSRTMVKKILGVEPSFIVFISKNS